MVQRRRHSSERLPPDDVEETKAHILAAGREVLLAARGALRFCKSYVETTPESESRPHLIGFFQKAIGVADELGKSILSVSPIGDTARGIAKSIFESMEQEMKRESRSKDATKRKTKIKSRKSRRSVKR